MDANEFLGHKYASAEDIVKAGKDNVICEILGVGEQKFTNKDNIEERKLTITLEGISKPIVLNKTNLKIIMGAYGPETDEWIGFNLTPIVIPGEMNGQQIKRIVLKPQ